MRKEVLFAAFLLSFILVVSGVDQCSQTGIGGIGGKTEAEKYGVDFTLETGIDTLSAGKTVYLGDSFFLDILVENYDNQAKIGEICVRDDIDEAYGGVPTSCRSFSIPAATYFENKIESPASLRIAFPESGDFSYAGLPTDINAKLYVSLSYTEHSVVSGTVKAPIPETETLVLQQPAAPVSVSVKKTISNRADNVKANLEITFTKQANYNITTTDFKRDALVLTPQLGTYTLDCPGLVQGFVDLKSTKFISCSAFLPREQITHPLLLTLDYGVKINKEFSYTIKKTG